MAQTTLQDKASKFSEDLAEDGSMQGVDLDIATIIAFFTTIFQLFQNCNKNADFVADCVRCQVEEKWYLGYFRHRNRLDDELEKRFAGRENHVWSTLRDHVKTWTDNDFNSMYKEVKKS